MRVLEERYSCARPPAHALSAPAPPLTQASPSSVWGAALASATTECGPACGLGCGSLSGLARLAIVAERSSGAAAGPRWLADPPPFLVSTRAGGAPRPAEHIFDHITEHISDQSEISEIFIKIQSFQDFEPKKPSKNFRLLKFTMSIQCN